MWILVLVGKTKALAHGPYITEALARRNESDVMVNAPFAVETVICCELSQR